MKELELSFVLSHPYLFLLSLFVWWIGLSSSVCQWFCCLSPSALSVCMWFLVNLCSCLLTFWKKVQKKNKITKENSELLFNTHEQLTRNLQNFNEGYSVIHSRSTRTRAPWSVEGAVLWQGHRKLPCWAHERQQRSLSWSSGHYCWRTTNNRLFVKTAKLTLFYS